MEKAIALKYDKALPAPFILAKGKGTLAGVITKIAQDHEVEIAHIPDLADALIELPVGSFIPENFYEIIAELLVFVMTIKEKR